MGYEFDILVFGFDEKEIRSDDPEELTLLLAHAKAEALLPKIIEPAILVTSDLVIWWNGKIFEKPDTPDMARTYLFGFGNMLLETVASVVVMNTRTKECRETVERARVVFSPIPSEVIDELVSDQDTLTHAGGFSVEDPRLAPYIARIDGELENVIGLPRKTTARFIEELVCHIKG